MINTQHDIENFNRVVLELFIRLYDSFPHPKNINSQAAKDIGFDKILSESIDEEDMSIGTKANDLMEWLREEGFIRYDPDPNYRPGTFWKVRLTIKALTILGYTPISLRKTDPKEPLILKAKRVILSAESSSGKEAIKRVVEEMFKLAIA